jgi:glycerol 2-dehydrogenase (NADP+)
MSISYPHLPTSVTNRFQHWPSSTDPKDTSRHLPDWNFLKTWEEMQKIPKSQARAIGVSNFSITNLEKLLSAPGTTTIPAVNQIELHPGCPSPKLVEFCKSKGIHCTAYSCLGSTNSPLAKNEQLKQLAAKKGKSTAQVLLKWGLQKGWSVIPKSVTTSRIADNFGLDGWELSADEMKVLDGFPDRFKVCGDSWTPVRIFDGRDE